MKTTNENKRLRIGFKYWNTDEEDFIVEEMPNPIHQINTTISPEDIKITPAHNEVVERLLMVETIILGKSFARLSKKKKQEYLNEQNFLKSLNEQLAKGY